MLAAPSRDWHVFTQIFAEHWDGFPHAHPRSPTPYYDNLVAKMLACGTPGAEGLWRLPLPAVGPGHPSGGDELPSVVVFAVCPSLRGHLGQPGEPGAP